VENYLNSVSPDLVTRLRRHAGAADVFAEKRIDEQILKGLDRKVYLPSGGHLVIDRTEAMTVIDVNTGKYTGAGGNLEETVTRNNLEAAEEIVRQLRLRDLGGIVVIDFIDMVLESNRELVLRRLTECLGRDRTKHQVTEITSLGLVQMTRKRIGSGLLEAFSETCDHCKGRGVIIHTEPVAEKRSTTAASQVKAVAAASRPEPAQSGRSRRRRGADSPTDEPVVVETEGPAAEAAELPPDAGSGIVVPAPQLTDNGSDDDYDISGYDLSRYESADDDAEPLQLTGTDDPDAADDEDDEVVGAGAGGRRRSRRGGTRRRTRP
jgi:ribonuclease E